MSTISQITMRRVYTVWLFRSLTGTLALKIYGILSALLLIGRLVFVERVIENAPSFFEPLALMRFATSAFFHTELAVQVAVTAMFGLCIWAFFELSNRYSLFGHSLSDR